MQQRPDCSSINALNAIWSVSFRSFFLFWFLFNDSDSHQSSHFCTTRTRKWTVTSGGIGYRLGLSNGFKATEIGQENGAAYFAPSVVNDFPRSAMATRSKSLVRSPDNGRLVVGFGSRYGERKEGGWSVTRVLAFKLLGKI